MRASRGEIKIEEILTLNGVSFEQEYIFSDLVSFSGHPLRFDFAVFDDSGELDFLIEYQGIQHYQPVEIFGGIEGYNQTTERDARKSVLCQKNGVKVIYWKYDEPITSKLLKEKLSDVI